MIIYRYSDLDSFNIQIQICLPDMDIESFPYHQNKGYDVFFFFFKSITSVASVSTLQVLEHGLANGSVQSFNEHCFGLIKYFYSSRENGFIVDFTAA